MLRTMAPGVVWVAALLASMLSLGRMFASDHLDGTLEQMLLSPQSLPMLVLGKALAHWLVTGVPLVLMAPVLGIQYHLEPATLAVLAAALALGTPVLSLLGSACTALSLGARGGGMLLALLALPLFVPVLVFGAGAAEAAATAVSPTPHLSILGAALILAAYVALQRGRLQRESRKYNALNLAGGTVSGTTYTSDLATIDISTTVVGSEVKKSHSSGRSTASK